MKGGALLPRGGAKVDGWGTPGIAGLQLWNPLLRGAYGNNPNWFPALCRLSRVTCRGFSI